MESLDKIKNKIVKKEVIEPQKKVEVVKSPTKEELLAKAHEYRLASRKAKQEGDLQKFKELDKKFSETLEKAQSI